MLPLITSLCVFSQDKLILHVMFSTSDKKTQQVVWDVWTNSVADEHYMDH